MGTRFTLQQFSEVLQIRNPGGHPYILIGGQAVNYWASRYLPAESGLKQYIPFTSEDIDFYGNREDVRHIAGQLNLEPVFPSKVAITSLAGIIPVTVANTRTNIEIIRTVPGVTSANMEALAVEMKWHNKVIRVLDPISLLVCKVELALTVAQQKRQDVEHLRILFYCVRGFLREWLQEVEAGNLPAKGWLGAANRLVKLAKSTHGRKAAVKLNLTWPEILPLVEIARCKDQKMSSFREKQLGGKRSGVSF